MPETMLSVRALTELLVKHFDKHDGLYDLSFEFSIGVGLMGPTPDSALPGAMIGFSKIGLAHAEAVGPHTVDASLVNPSKKQRKASKTAG